jgi:hypothetical protein
MVKYCAPRVEDFGTIERQVYFIGSPPNEEFPENGPLPSTTDAGGGGGAFGLLGVAAAGIAAVVAGRNNSPVEPVVGPVDEDEEVAAKAIQ